METLFRNYKLGDLTLANHFVFPPIKLAYGNPDGTVSERQLMFYRQIASNGPGIIILEPAAVTLNGREHPKQLCVHLPNSANELKKIVDVIHSANRLACLHLNHAGAAANPLATKSPPKAPSMLFCATSGQEAKPLSEEEIEQILNGYRTAAHTAALAGFDVLEIQAGHGYLISQFLNEKINTRSDAYGKDRLLFAKKALSAVKEGAPELPFIVRVSGNEMAPEFGLRQENLAELLNLAKEYGAKAIHVGMGNVCFSPPWYFHHGSLPEKPQYDALEWVRNHTTLPIIAAGRMGRKQKAYGIVSEGLADLIALGRPLIADPHILQKWQKGDDTKVISCGYCLQGCLHRVKNGEMLGCNLNPEIGLPSLSLTDQPKNVLIAGAGPAGISAALSMRKRGHRVTIVEQRTHMGGQFALAWKAPGKETLKAGLDGLEQAVEESGATIYLNIKVDPVLVRQLKPDVLIWATGAVQNIPDIPGLKEQYVLTSFEYFEGEKKVIGPRILVIGAGRTGLEIAEKLGNEGYEVVATKRSDPLGSMMEAITRTLILTKIKQNSKINLMPHTTVKAFFPDHVEIEQEGEKKSLKPFQTVILCSGTVSADGPNEAIKSLVPSIEIIGDATEPKDIFAAVHAGYALAERY